MVEERVNAMRGYKACVGEPISQTPIIMNNLQRLEKPKDLG
jgi:hypothetical protein